MRYFMLNRMKLFNINLLCCTDMHLLTQSMEHSPLEKVTGSQLVKKFPTLYGIWKFIITFTTARQLSLYWASSIQSIPPHLTSWRSILILSSHLFLGFPSGLLPSGFPTKTLCTSLLPHTCYMPRRSHSSQLNHPNNTGRAIHIIKIPIT